MKIIMREISSGKLARIVYGEDKNTFTLGGPIKIEDVAPTKDLISWDKYKSVPFWYQVIAHETGETIITFILGFLAQLLILPTLGWSWRWWKRTWIN